MSEFIGNMIIPSPYDVRYGVGEGSGGSEFTGNFTLPLTDQVVGGVGYGSGGVEFLGTLFCINDNLNLFIRGNISGTPSVGDDNFGITLDQLFKNGDFNPQIIGRFTTNPSSVTIELWDTNNNFIVLSSYDCYQIGDTGRWAFSTINLLPLPQIVNQFIFRMTGDNLETFESQFILRARRKNSYGKVPRDNSQIRKV